MDPLPWTYDDGGRADTGRRGTTGDCVTRAIAIATGQPYADVYADLARLMAARGGPRSARNGIPRDVYQPYLFDHGWIWAATMGIGTGCTVHLRVGEVPDDGPIVARLSRHVTAVVGGVVRDTFDPTRGGTRCVYGWFEPGLGIAL